MVLTCILQGSPPGTGGPAAGGAPPPPPPPTVVPPSGPAPASKDTGVSSALFGQINKAGTDIATGKYIYLTDRWFIQILPVPRSPWFSLFHEGHLTSSIPRGSSKPSIAHV